MIYCTPRIKKRPETFELNKRHPLATGLVFAGLGAHAGSSRYHDSSVFGNTGTLTNMDPATDWVRDGTLNRFVLNFDGTNQYINCGAASSLDLTSAFTLSAWTERADIDDSGAIFHKSAPSYTAPYYQWGLQFKSYREIHFQADIGGTSTKILEATVGTGLIHFTMVCDGTSAAIYQNGSLLVGPSALGGAIVSHPTWNVIIGGTQFVDNAGFKWVGSISDPIIHNRPLSLPEIQILANPSDPMLGGFLVETDWQWVPWVGGGAPATGNRRRRLIITGASR